MYIRVIGSTIIFRFDIEFNTEVDCMELILSES